MRKLILVLPTFALLGGCGLNPLEIGSFAVSTARTVDCYIASRAINQMVRTDTAIACHLLGGTVAQ